MTHECYYCNKKFRTKKKLFAHLDKHSSIKIPKRERVIKVKKKKQKKKKTRRKKK